MNIKIVSLTLIGSWTLITGCGASRKQQSSPRPHVKDCVEVASKTKVDTFQRYFDELKSQSNLQGSLDELSSFIAIGLSLEKATRKDGNALTQDQIVAFIASSFLEESGAMKERFDAEKFNSRLAPKGCHERE